MHRRGGEGSTQTNQAKDKSRSYRIREFLHTTWWIKAKESKINVGRRARGQKLSSTFSFACSICLFAIVVCMSFRMKAQVHSTASILYTRSTRLYSQILLTQLLVSLVSTGNVHERIQHHLHSEQFWFKKKEKKISPILTRVILGLYFLKPITRQKQMESL